MGYNYIQYTCLYICVYITNSDNWKVVNNGEHPDNFLSLAGKLMINQWSEEYVLF